MKIKMKRCAAGKLFIILLTIVFIFACEKTNDLPDHNPPSDHTISEDGILHKIGLHQPLTDCVYCHGDDLTGGTAGVSCYECHGKKW